MGNNDHKGGLIIHYEYLTAFLKRQEGFELFLININDTNQKLFDDSKIIEVNISYKPKNNFLKSINLLITGLKAKSWKPDIFIACGLGYGFNFIARILGPSTFKVQQEVHFDATLDLLRYKSSEVFDAIAVQTYSMIGNYKKNVSNKLPINYLPCFTKNLPELKENISLASITNIKLGFFGRLAPNKGLEPFLKNVKNIILNKKIEINIYGNGPSFDSIFKVIKDNRLERFVKLHGFFNDSDYVELINSHNAIIIPSIYNEGLPLVTLEAMKYGKPIYASNIGAFPEIARVNKGLILSNTDSKSQNEVFEKFILALENGSFNKFYINKTYEDFYSNKTFEEKWLKMFQSPKKYFK